MDWILDVDIADGAVFWVACLLSALVLAVLLAKRPTLRWLVTVLILLAAGIGAGLLTLWLAVDVLDAFGGPVNAATWFWVPACFAAILIALANLFRSPLWRKALAIFAVPLFAISTLLIINSAYNITPTVGAFLYINTTPDIALIQPTDPLAPDPTEPVAATWTPPADMPSTGRFGVLQPPIPNVSSGFDARPAEVYYPPAALVDDPPRLPVVIMMMGHPGMPDASIIAGVLDGFAARHGGLAPIAVVIDQLGSPTADPLCLDSDRGNVETYIMGDVVPWVSDNLGVLRDRTDWVIAGYSNGGQCASYLGAKHPDVFGSILAVSPEEFAGIGDEKAVLAEVFGGDQAAYDAAKPATIMSATDYPDTAAVFTAGASDVGYLPDARHLAAAAEKAGMDTSLVVVPNADHGRSGVVGGLTAGFGILAKRLGLVTD